MDLGCAFLSVSSEFPPKKTGCLARFFLAGWSWQGGVDSSVISDSDI